jgi:hypothetical protein
MSECISSAERGRDLESSLPLHPSRIIRPCQPGCLTMDLVRARRT